MKKKIICIFLILILLIILGFFIYKNFIVKNNTNEEIQDYTVYPLEGIWKRIEDSELIKENLEYTITYLK